MHCLPSLTDRTAKSSLGSQDGTDIRAYRSQASYTLDVKVTDPSGDEARLLTKWSINITDVQEVPISVDRKQVPAEVSYAVEINN